MSTDTLSHGAKIAYGARLEAKPRFLSAWVLIPTAIGITNGAKVEFDLANDTVHRFDRLPRRCVS